LLSKNIVNLQKQFYEFITRRLGFQLEGDANAVILDVRTEDEYNDGIISMP
jgi:rhodanese-related sulfurtransferase